MFFIDIIIKEMKVKFYIILIITVLTSFIVKSQNGLIIKVISESTVEINLGHRQGILKGDKFIVIDSGQQIHPATGNIVETPNAEIAQLEVITVFEENSTAIVINASSEIRTNLKVTKISEIQNDKQGSATQYIPVITLTESDLDSDELSQDISAILQSSGDVFVRTAGYTFGSARFRMRGYDSDLTAVMINGISVNDAETGRAYWSNWGGLNDAMWNREVRNGLTYSDLGFGGIGGITNISTRVSEFRPQSRVSYASANTSYRNRIMATHSTGLMQNNWAYTVSVSKRWAEQGYVEGTFYDAYSYFAGIERKINNQHSIGLTVFGAPSRRGRAGVGTMEVYELTGNNYYNPNWGYQNGEIRNSRVNNYHQPKSIITHYWKIDDKKSLTSSLAYTFGKGGATALNWYDAADPRPDYYRYLPSYYDEDEFMHTHLTHKWQNDITFRQLNWDEFYHANRKNLFTVLNSEGIEGNNITGNRSKFILEERRNDIRRADLSSVYTQTFNNDMRMSAGVVALTSNTHNYKLINDLLGGDWWLDIDQFAERDFSDNYTIQNDVNNPDRIVKVGDKFGYDYVANINRTSIFAQAEKSFKKLDLFAGAELSYNEFWRTGNMMNGKFPENSFGDSPKNVFLNYALKAGFNYKITGRHLILGNIAYLTKAPNFRDAYLSVRTRDHVVNNITSENIMSADINYLLRGRFIQARLTAYYTDFRNQIWNRSFYHDELRTFVNYAMTGIDKIHTGVEFGMEAKITSDILLTGALAYGKYYFNSRPFVTIAQDNNSEVLVEDRQIYIKNYHVGGMPELAASVGLRYNSPKYWFVAANLNYFDYTYIEINPDRRTEEAMQNFVSSDPQVSQILGQKKLEPGMTLDLWGGKNWRIKRKYFVGFSLSVNNALNNKTFTTNGFEQLRYDVADIDKFPEKYFYLYGRTYFANLYFRF